MTSKNRIPEGQLWLRYSAEDLDLAVKGLTDKDFRPRHVCWNAQQAAEKALKAALLLEGKKSPFSHDLDELVEHLPDTWPVRRVRIDLAASRQWSVEGCYPGAWREATAMDAEQAVARARRIHASVKAEFERRLGDATPSE